MVDQKYPINHTTAAFCLSVVLLVARMAYTRYLSPYGLGPDEAQYWHWLQYLDWSYATKPPLTTALIGLSTALLGHTVLGVKLFALVSQAFTPFLLFLIAKKVSANPSAPWLAYVLAAASPLVAAGGTLMSPDAVLLPLILTATLLALVASPNWVAIGVLVGLAGLAKYTAVLFLPLLALYAAVHRREWFTQRGPYIAAAIAALMQAPVLYWNAMHDWAGFHHLLWQADGGGDARHGGLATLAEFLLSQFGVLGPVAFVGILCGWGVVAFTLARSFRSPETPTPHTHAQFALTYLTLPVFLAFTLQTFGAKVQPNWPLLGTIPALPLAAMFLTKYVKNLFKAVVIIGICVTVLASAILQNTPAARALGVPLRIKIDPTKDMLAAPQLGKLVGALHTQIQSDSYVLTTRYQTTAQLAFHARRAGVGLIPTLYLNPGDKRQNQYDFWPWPNLDGKLVIYVNTTPNLPAAVQERFRQCQQWQQLQTAYAEPTPLARAYTWLCMGQR